MIKHKNYIKYLSVLLLIICIPLTAFAGIDFDGVDDFVENTSIDMSGKTNGAIFAHFKTDETTGPAGIAGVRELLSSGEGFLILIQSDSIYFQVGEGTQWGYFSFSDTSNWHTIILNYDGSGATDADKLKGYLDGVEQEMTFSGFPIPASLPDISTAHYRIGSRYLSTNYSYYDGQITEVAIWDATLTSNNIANLSDSYVKRMPLQIYPSNLVGYWSIDDGQSETSADGDTVSDLSGNGNNGTGDDGGNNTGLTWKAEEVLSYP